MAGSMVAINGLRLVVVGDAKVNARQAGLGGLIAGFEVHDNVVLMASNQFLQSAAPPAMPASAP